VGNYCEGTITSSKPLKSNPSLKALCLRGNKLVASFNSYSTDTIDLEAVEELKSRTSLASLNVRYTWKAICGQGAIKLAEALKSNSFITSLDLSCNKLSAPFHSHSTQ
jgi:hypothetical protein